MSALVPLGVPAFVRRQAGQLTLGGAAWLPRGVNSYPLLQHAGHGALAAVHDILDQAVALGRPLIRTPAFLDAGHNPARIRDDAGRIREAGLLALDRVIAAAAERGVRLILVLTNNWPDFGGAPALLRMIGPRERLPKDAFWSDPRALAAQLAYQRALVSRVNHVNGVRYADDPTILAWELANEARLSRPFWRRKDPRILARWARTMADGLRGAGVQQLIAWGGSGHLGRYGEDLRVIAAEGGVDLLTLHMYGPASPKSGAAQRWGERTLLARGAVARAAELPLLLEEASWAPASSDPVRRDAERARVLGAWLEIAHGLGVGSLPWMIGERGRPDHDGHLIRPEHEHTRQVLMR